MEQILEYIQSNIQMAPYLIFGLLLLAGFNLPVSEDVMLLISAMLAAKNPDYLVQLFVAVYLGAYFSDLICFSLGYFLGEKLLKIRFFSKMINQKTLNKLHHFYKKYGVLTLIFGRFIPFGVRNGLFLTAGFGKMNPIKFALSDLLAATISCSSFFYLYYTFGERVVELVKKGNYVIFALALLVGIHFILKKKRSHPPASM